jgi:hypothetical protein
MILALLLTKRAISSAFGHENLPWAKLWLPHGPSGQVVAVKLCEYSLLFNNKYHGFRTVLVKFELKSQHLL